MNKALTYGGVTSLIIIFMISCSPQKIIIDNEEYPTSGTATIDTKLVNGQRMGFSFAVADTIYYLNYNSTYPDIALRISSSDASKLEFFAIEVRPAFKMVFSSSYSDSAQLWFDSLKTITDTTSFLSYGPNVAAYQVWLVCTNINKYAKILVNYTNIDTNNVGTVIFDWVYQPDGSLTFPAE